MRRVIGTAALVLALAGCMDPTPVRNDFTSDTANAFGYVRDERTGLCFSMFTVQRLASNGTLAISTSHSNVPCNEAVLALVRAAKK